MEIKQGLPAKLIKQAIELYYNSLHQKLKPVFGNKDSAVSYLINNIDPTKCIFAIDNEEVIGILGIQDINGSFLTPSFSQMVRKYGFFSSLFRFLLLILMNYDIKPNELHLDGIAVSPNKRGQGIGSRLISEFENYAGQRNIQLISLEVINTNPDAKKLYNRLGFKEIKSSSVWPFTKIFGFSSSTLMTKDFK